MAESKSARDVAAEVLKSVRDEIAVYEQGLVRMRALEVGALKKNLFGLPHQAESNKEITAKVHRAPKTIFDILGKSELHGLRHPSGKLVGSKIKITKPSKKPKGEKVFLPGADGKPIEARLIENKKSEDYIDARGDADPKKRYVHVGAYDNKAEPKKEVPAPGSGGKLGKDKKLTKDALNPAKPPKQPVAPALKPAGVPGMKAGEAPKPPMAPGAPGMKKDCLDEHKPVGVFAKLAAHKSSKGKIPGLHKAGSEIAGANSAGPVMAPTMMAMGEKRTVFEILKKNEGLEKVAPPGFDEKTMHKLKDKYGTESAFKIAWAAHKKKGKTKKSEEDMQCPYCRLHLGVCPC